MKTSWNLKLFYKSFTDKNIERDLKKVDSAVNKFVGKYYQTTNYLKSDQKLHKSLQDYQKVYVQLASARPLMYFYYHNCLNTNNPNISAKLNGVHNLYNQFENRIIFFENRLKKLKPAQQEKFLASKVLLKYRYYLKRLFNWSKHTLSEEGEQIMNLKNLPAQQLWVQFNERVVNRQIIKFENLHIPIHAALNKIATLPQKKRRLLHLKVYRCLQRTAEFSEAELNAILLDQQINNRLRGFPKPYQSRLLNDQIDESTVNNLIAIVTENFKISHNYYEFKRRLLKLPKLKYEDRSVAIGKLKWSMSFIDAVKILTDCYRKLDQSYVNLFKQFLQNGQLDVFPRANKHGGAFCSWSENNPTMLLLNQVEDVNSLFTLAHELGHAFHAEFSKKQNRLMRQPSTASAEVASTLFENILYDYLLDQTANQERIFLLQHRLNADISAIFRQIAFYKFELELRERYTASGQLTREQIAKLFSKHLQSYLGPAFNLRTVDGYGYVYTSHFRNFFYVYSYAYGRIISRVLSEKLKADSHYNKEIKRFLSSGGKAEPNQIFKNLGLSVDQKSFWQAGLANIEQDIVLLKKLSQDA